MTKTPPDRLTREQVAQSIAGRIDWTPTVLAGSDPRMSIVEQVLRLAEYETSDEARALRSERAAVRALHVPASYSAWACEECSCGCGTGDVELPCPTLRALDGEAS